MRKGIRYLGGAYCVAGRKSMKKLIYFKKYKLILKLGYTHKLVEFIAVGLVSLLILMPLKPTHGFSLSMLSLVCLPGRHSWGVRSEGLNVGSFNAVSFSYRAGS